MTQISLTFSPSGRRQTAFPLCVNSKQTVWQRCVCVRVRCTRPVREEAPSVPQEVTSRESGHETTKCVDEDPEARLKQLGRTITASNYHLIKMSRNVEKPAQ